MNFLNNLFVEKTMTASQAVIDMLADSQTRRLIASILLSDVSMHASDYSEDNIDVSLTIDDFDFSEYLSTNTFTNTIIYRLKRLVETAIENQPGNYFVQDISFDFDTKTIKVELKAY